MTCAKEREKASMAGAQRPQGRVIEDAAEKIYKANKTESSLLKIRSLSTERSKEGGGAISFVF